MLISKFINIPPTGIFATYYIPRQGICQVCFLPSYIMQGGFAIIKGSPMNQLLS